MSTALDVVILALVIGGWSALALCGLFPFVDALFFSEKRENDVERRLREIEQGRRK